MDFFFFLVTFLLGGKVVFVFPNSSNWQPLWYVRVRSSKKDMDMFGYENMSKNIFLKKEKKKRKYK